MAIDYTKNAVTGEPLTPYQMSFDPAGNPAATSPAKSTYIANVAKSSSPGSYKGVPINAGTDAEVASQMKSIDATPGSPSSTATTPTPPAPAPTAADTAFADYLSSLSQSSDVTEATKYVNSLITQGKQNQETALNRGETLGFATGEAARVARNDAITLDAASRGLDALIASGASKKEVAKARYDYEQAKIASADKANPPFELSPGQQRYTYDPVTKSYKLTASAPATPTKVTAADKQATIMADVNSAVSQLGQIVKAKGFRGVSPDDYNTMREYLQKEYGVNGVIELDKAMKALGLTVDVDWAKEDAKLKK